MRTFRDLANDEGNPGVLRDVYSVLDGGKKAVGDAAGNTHSIKDIEEIRDLMYYHTEMERAVNGEKYETLTEARKSTVLAVGDAIYNSVSGIGTNQDTSYFNKANIPISIAPYEATALLASGGLPEIIINKKSKGILLNGYSFHSESEFWTEDKIKQIKRRAEELDLEGHLSESLTEGFVYGGSVLYPVFKKDTARTFGMSLKQLMDQGILDKDSIARFTGTDRWNVVVVPDFTVTTADYLFAKTFYIPMTGYTISTQRAAVIKPKKLPFWGAIRQLGWGISDFEGYMRAIMSYEVMMASIPMMAQQMSLIVRKLPLDGLMAMNGIDSVKDLIKDNEQKMKEWSVANPQILNDIGSIEVINRNFTGYSDLCLTIRQNIAAQSEIPESVLFHTQPKGFNNNTEEVLLKQSETIKLSQKRVLPSLNNLKDILIIDVFGKDSDECKNHSTLKFTFDNPVMATETERAETAARWSATINSARQAGMDVDQAALSAKQFFKSFEIDDELLKSLQASAERHKQKEELEMEKQRLEIELMKKQLQEQPDDSNNDGKGKDKSKRK